MPKKTKPQGDIPYVVPGSVDPDAYEATPQETKKARRQWAKQNQEYILQELARGKTPAQLGITDEKEGGRSMYRMLGMRGEQGFQDPNWTYNWENGTKINHATSDVNARNRPVPIEPREYAERDAQRSFGTGPDAWVRRLQADEQSRLQRWARENEAKGGTLRSDNHGLYMLGNEGERYDFDAYGNLIDANTGQPIGDHQYGMGTDLLGAASGYKSPYGSGATTGGIKPAHPDSPSATTPAAGNPPGTQVAGAQVASPGMSPITANQPAPAVRRSAYGSGGIPAAGANKPQPAMQRPAPLAGASFQPQTARRQPPRSAYGSQQNPYGIY